MTTEIALTFLSYREDNPRGRWDSLWLERMLAGEEGCPPGGYRFVDTPFTPSDGKGRVIIFPAGTYADHGQERMAIERLIADLYRLPWAVLFATSDECQTFPWHLYADTWPAHVQLWVQLPRPENVYPPGTRFFGEGSPASAKQIAVRAQPDWQKDIDVFFSGQMGHDRRVAMWEALGPLRERTDINVVAQATAGFTQGMEIDEYLTHMARAWIAPCPSGIQSQSSFRFFEALEAQCIPLADEARPDRGGRGFWTMLGLDWCGLSVDKWSDLPGIVDNTLEPPDVLTKTAITCQSRWQQYKRRTLNQIHDDVRQAMFPKIILDMDLTPDDMITVVMPTSPMPANPSLDIILETIASIRERLPRAEILITCDGVRPEQAERTAAYYEYVRRLLAWTNSQDNITPFVLPEFSHQSGAMQYILPEIQTPYVMYVENDCPLWGEIDFAEVLDEMSRFEIAHMRFMHETHVLDSHTHLFLETTPEEGKRHLRTVQFSTRPSVMRFDWLREQIGTFFGPKARTMLEDAMYGPWQAGVAGPGVDDPYTAGTRLLEAWYRNRGAVWAKHENLKHSWHLDGRGGEPKFEMTYDYPTEEIPPGAPRPGTR